MSLTSSEASTGTTDSRASLTLSGQYGGTPPLSFGSAATPLSFSPSFSSRRGNIKFSSARFNPPSKIRSSKRGRGMSSFGRSTRRTATRPARTKGVFEKLLSGLAEGIEAVRGCVEELRIKLYGTKARVNYYMDLEKQVKGLERKIRTLEVHRDRIEEMRDEYILKLKLREGAFNIAQALSSQTSKAAKEKLQEARLEQRELLEDLCDIEDELETKLGVFKVHINDLVGIGRAGSGGGDIIETQLKLSSQKWKAKCRVNRHEQSWQDEDIIFLGKVMDELFVKVVDVKKIQGNVLLGNMKCQTREFFSFFPLTVTFDFPTSTAKLSMDVRWSPTIGEDFLNDLDLATVQCIVGGAQSKSASRAMNVGSVERLNLDTGLQKIRIIAEPDGGDDLDPQSSATQVKSEVSKTQPKQKKVKKKKKKEESDFVFMDRQSIIDSEHSTSTGSIDAYHQFTSSERSASSSVERFSSAERPSSSEKMKVFEYSSSPKKHHSGQHPLHQDSRDSSLKSNNSSGSGRSVGSLSRPHLQRQRTPEMLTLSGMLEAVMAALEEPREVYTELSGLGSQLSRLEVALRGGQLKRAPSMTFSESQAMGTFEFLGSDENIVMPRTRNSVVDISDDHRRTQLSNKYQHSSSGSTTTPTSESVDVDLDSRDGDSLNSQLLSSSKIRNGFSGSSGSHSVDKALIQHLIHCESLLVHLHSFGPLKYKLTASLGKLQDEAGVISELLNMAADPENLPQVGQTLPELAADDQLMEFWRYLARDDLLSVSYEQFAVDLDERFGQSLWNEFPEMANKVLTELIFRVLDLETEEWELDDQQMVVTIFQFSSYFLSQGSKGVAKCLREVAQELKVTEGLEANETETKKRIASMLPNYGYNKGALLAAAHLLADPNPALHKVPIDYIGNFSASSPWHTKAVAAFIELLEHSDQKVRIGACNALSHLKATCAASQLKYLSRRDFSPVRVAATNALESMGGMALLDISDQPRENGSRHIGGGTATCSKVKTLTPDCARKHSNLHRTRSAELPSGNDL